MPPRAPSPAELGACPGCGAPILVAAAHYCNRCGRPLPPAPRASEGVGRWALIGALIITAIVTIIVVIVIAGRGPGPTSGATSSSSPAPTAPLGPAAVGPALPALPPPPLAGPPAPATLELRTTIEPAGAALALGAGLTLTVPPGAVDAPTAFTFRVLEQLPPDLAGGPPGLVFEGVGAAARFARPLELTVPLPPEVTDDQAASALTGTLDRGALVIDQPVRVADVDGQRALIVPIDHFSVHVLVIVGGVLVIKGAFVAFDAIRGWIWAPPAAVAPLAIPVYHQGDGPECLAASVAMLTKALKPDSKEIWRLMEGAGITTRGESAFWLRWSGGVRDEVRRIVGVDPEVNLWQPIAGLDTGPILGALKRYVRQQLAAGHPVVFSSTAMAMGGSSDVTHAVVLVGYDDTGYFAANPQNNSDTDAAVRHYSEAELGITWTVAQSYVTLVVDRALAADRTTLTANFPPGAVWFQTLAGASATIYAMTWDGARPGGIRWSQHGKLSGITNPGTPVDAVPGDVTMLQVGQPDPDGGPAFGGVEVTNSDAAPQSATVTLQLYDLTAGKQPVALAGDATTLTQTVELAGHAKRRVGFVVEVMRLRPPTVTTARQFQVVATVTGTGGRDSATVEFTLAPPPAQPLVGVWEGQAFGAGPMTITITRQHGDDFEGTFALQGTTLGLAGTWDRAAGAWTLELWERPGSEPALRFPAPGSLVPYSGGRLQLTAPGGLLVKRGAPVGDGRDDHYQMIDEYLRALPQK